MRNVGVKQTCVGSELLARNGRTDLVAAEVFKSLLDSSQLFIAVLDSVITELAKGQFLDIVADISHRFLHQLLVVNKGQQLLNSHRQL